MNSRSGEVILSEIRLHCFRNAVIEIKIDVDNSRAISKTILPQNYRHRAEHFIVLLYLHICITASTRPSLWRGPQLGHSSFTRSEIGIFFAVTNYPLALDSLATSFWAACSSALRSGTVLSFAVFNSLSTVERLRTCSCACFS